MSNGARAIVLAALLPGLAAAQNTADDYFPAGEMAAARESLKHHSGDTVQYLLLGERLENRFHDGDSSVAWEGQGWVGKDLDKLWLKTEGHYDAEEGSTGEAELQVLYSRAIDPFWELQMGLRHDFRPGPARDYAVLGLQGLAPYWFELDLAAFLSEEGEAAARLEAEYEIRFTQRLILQPRMELNYAFGADAQAGIGKGLNSVHAGLRLRYELRREFAPYLGVAWERSYGDTADLLRLEGGEPEEFSLLAGIRFWY